jgi:hypothetical protein
MIVIPPFYGNAVLVFWLWLDGMTDRVDVENVVVVLDE